MRSREQLARFGTIGAVFVVSFLTPSSSEVKPFVQAEQQYLIDLGLKIDEAGFFKAASANPQFGILTETWDKDKMDCLKPLGDFCVAEASPNFKVAINKPMADFMIRQSGLFNPSLPTRMIFAEDWIDVTKDEHAGGYTALADDGSDQIIVISLKSAAFEAFKIIDARNYDSEAFNWAMSVELSRVTAHEWAHAGTQTKKLLRPGMRAIPDNLVDLTHPQIFTFSDRYFDLYKLAFDKNLGQGALIFGVGLEKTNVSSYRAQIYREAKDLGIIK